MESEDLDESHADRKDLDIIQSIPISITNINMRIFSCPDYNRNS